MDSTGLLEQPFVPPPANVKSNYLDPQTRGVDLTISCSVFFGLMVTFAAIRAYVKLWISRRLTWDDRNDPIPHDRRELINLIVTFVIGFVFDLNAYLQ